MRRMFGARALRNPLLLGGGSFPALTTLEIVTEEDGLSVVDLGVDAVTYLLIVGSAVGVGRVVARIDEQEAEKVELLEDLEIARAEGDGWRAKAQAIYRKAGLSGKTAFSAHFLEDLFSSDEARPSLRLLGE